MAFGHEGEQGQVLAGVVVVEALAEREAVDAELGAEGCGGCAGGQLVANQGQFAAERVVHHLDGLAEGRRVDVSRAALRQAVEGYDRDHSGGLLLVRRPARVRLHRSGEEAVAFLAGEDLGPCLVGEHATLDDDLGVGDEVVEPVRCRSELTAEAMTRTRSPSGR